MVARDGISDGSCAAGASSPSFRSAAYPGGGSSSQVRCTRKLGEEAGEFKELFIILNDPPLPFFLRESSIPPPRGIFDSNPGVPTDMLVPKLAV